MTLHRDEFQRTAVTKCDDAQLLFANGRFSSAYYLFGYTVEMALKARIARRFLADSLPEKRLVIETYSHDVERLLYLAHLGEEFQAALRAEPRLEGAWRTVLEWTPDSRYIDVGQARCTSLRDAVVHSDYGVFQWLRARW